MKTFQSVLAPIILAPIILAPIVLAAIVLATAFPGPASAEGPRLPAPNVASPQNPLRTGIFRGKPVTYVEIGGRPILQGDILLDHVAPAPAPGRRVTPAVGVAYTSYLWPKVGGVAIIPYVVTSGSANLTSAIAQFNATFTGVIQLTPRVAQADYVEFDLNAADHSGVCFSNLGHVGGKQSVGGSIDCVVGTLLHEIGHAVGLYHEHSRADRDTYVTVSTAAMIRGSQSNFDKLIDNFETLAPYDYASIMHYVPFAFTRNGKPVLESKPSGIPLSNTTAYTASDIDVVRRMYGAAPAAVTVTSNPVGLKVKVDGVVYTAPQTFNWALNSTHTLATIPGPQTVGGTSYIYGRWSADTRATHSITVSAGRGTPAQPTSAPAVSVYTVNYRELVAHSVTVSPPGSGTVVATPAPRAIAGLAGQYYYARQSVKLTATPSAGHSFLAWSSPSAPFISPPWSANPKTEYAPGAVVATFTQQPVYTMTTSPAGLGMLIDGQFWYGPQNFSSDFLPSWTPGSTHAVSTYTPQYPYSINTRHKFTAWSDRGAMTHNYLLPATSSTLTARFISEYAPVVYATPWCAASVSLTPPSPTGDGFYRLGTTVTATATPASGWVFTGWRNDLTGPVNPKPVVLKGEILAVADYNTVATPLTATSLSPATVSVGSAPFTLAIGGAGFTPSSIVFVNNFYRPSTFVSPTQINVSLTGADVATSGAFPIGVSNFPSGAPCSTYAPQGFFVTSP